MSLTNGKSYLKVITYTADGKSLATTDAAQAASDKLETIADPFANLRISNPLEVKPHGHFRCPECNEQKLEFRFRGKWD
jgi:hypothetical protein